MATPRSPLLDRSNDPYLPNIYDTPSSPSFDTTFASSSPESKYWARRDDRGSKKRQRVDEDEELRGSYGTFSIRDVFGPDSEDEEEDAEYEPKPTPLTSHRILRAMASSTRRGRAQPLSTRPVLQSLVSSHQSDVYRIHSSTGNNLTFDIPIACAYSHGAKQGRNQLLATSTQEGKVEIIDTRKREPSESEPARVSLQAHDNAVFDIRWNENDTRLATASGDRTSRIFDVQSSKLLAVLAGHEGSLKQIQWDLHNPNTLATASRDGNINIWDLRNRDSRRREDVGESRVNVHQPIMTLIDAHGEKKRRGRKNQKALPRSVTSISFAKKKENHLLSAGSGDGVVKLWDLRQTKSQLRCVETSIDSTLMNGDSRRARGICSLAQDKEGDWCFALGSDSRIHIYPALSLSNTMNALSTPLPTPLSYPPRFRVSSFYVRLAVSPCGNWLASGSTGGETFIWDLRRVLGRNYGDNLDAETGRRPVMLGTAQPQSPALSALGVKKEIGCVDWSSDGGLAQCSDDMTVRVWRADPEISSQCRDVQDADNVRETESAAWNWAFALN